MLEFRSNFSSDFGDFGAPKWHPTSHKKRPQSPGPAQSPPRARPEASREPFGRHFGLILASIWALRGLMFELFRGARLLLLACCSSIAGALFLLRPLHRCSPSEPPGNEVQVTKVIASWPRSIMPSFFWGSAAGGRSPLNNFTTLSPIPLLIPPMSPLVLPHNIIFS